VFNHSERREVTGSSVKRLVIFVSTNFYLTSHRSGMNKTSCGVIVTLFLCAAARAEQTEQDEYTLYELLSPESASFKITYEVTATTPGAKAFFNPIRKGSVASDEAVFDMMTGEPLKFEQVSGAQAKEQGLADADAETDYIRVDLARPVPADGGQARIRIVKTYKDAKSYRTEGEAIVFERPLGIRRNAVVLPSGYRLTACNVPSQVLSEGDGRTRISFMHQAPGQAALILKASPGAQTTKPRALTDARSWELPPKQAPTERERLGERAHQDRDIIYYLQAPETHAFSLSHDYSESREGTDKYLHVVRPGSRVSEPSGKILDTGEALKVEVLTGAKLKAAKVDTGEEKIALDQQVVVFRFPAVKRGQSIRLRMSETYTAPECYRLEGDELVFDRSFGRPRNSIVLPQGWYLTALSIPAVVRQTPDGLTRIDFVNGRPDAIAVLLKAKKISAPPS
jgi:hypothetical protein